MSSKRSWESFQGLNAILESPQWSISKTCQAVEACLDVNKYGSLYFAGVCPNRT